MELQNQQEINAYHENYLNQLDHLAEQGASAYAQVAKDAAKHEFGIKFAYELRLAMAKALEQTYYEIVQDVENLLNQFAQNSAKKALDVESSTVGALPEIKLFTPKFASFSETLTKERNQQSNLLKLHDVQVNSESDKLALQSLGFVIDNNNDTNNHNGNGNNSH